MNDDEAQREQSAAWDDARRQTISNRDVFGKTPPGFVWGLAVIVATILALATLYAIAAHWLKI